MKRNSALLCLLFVTLVSPLAANDASTVETNQVSKPKTIAFANLPKPPAEILEIIKRANVRFFLGERPASELLGKKIAGAPEGTRVAAETHFQLAYDYRCQMSYGVKEIDGNRELQIVISFSKIRLLKKHDVWFLHRPERSTFWTNPLVLHEFDHVRISSDPRIEKRFADQLHEHNTVSIPIQDRRDVTNELVNQTVEKHVKMILDETVELAIIRNDELDRQTMHGLKPLSDQSSLAELLR